MSAKKTIERCQKSIKPLTNHKSEQSLKDVKRICFSFIEVMYICPKVYLMFQMIFFAMSQV